MPLWDFFCVKCQTSKELMFKNYELSKKAKCEVCKTKLSRLASAAHANFVGKDFYETTYKQKS